MLSQALQDAAAIPELSSAVHTLEACVLAAKSTPVPLALRLSPQAFSRLLSEACSGRVPHRATRAWCRVAVAIAGLTKRGTALGLVPAAAPALSVFQDEQLLPRLAASTLPGVVARKWTTALLACVQEDTEASAAAMQGTASRWVLALAGTVMSSDADGAFAAGRRRGARLALSLANWRGGEPAVTTGAWRALPALLNVDAVETAAASAAATLVADDTDLVGCVWQLWCAQPPADAPSAAHALVSRSALLAALCSVLGYSADVAAEWLLGTETDFLPLLLDVATWAAAGRTGVGVAAADCLGEPERAFLAQLHARVMRLEATGAFPYNVNPLLRRLAAASGITDP